MATEAIDWQAHREGVRERVVQSWNAGYASGQREARAWMAGMGFVFSLSGVVIGVVLTVLVLGWLR